MFSKKTQRIISGIIVAILVVSLVVTGVLGLMSM